MLSHRIISCNPNDLELGCHLNHVDYVWREFDDRLPDHKEDYCRLFNDIQSRGIVNPLIIFRGHVLIGQRRCEIAQIQRIPLVECIEITEDITDDPNADRVEELKNLYQKVNY